MLALPIFATTLEVLMFANDRRSAQICSAILAWAGLERLWSSDSDGPTGEAMALLEQDGGPLSSGERTILLLAFALWNNNPKLSVDRLFGLDRARLHAVGTLLVAISEGTEGGALEHWLDENRRALSAAGKLPLRVVPSGA